MKKIICFFVAILLFSVSEIFPQAYQQGEKVNVVIVKNPFGASHSIMEEGLPSRLEIIGCEICKDETFELTAQEQEYRAVVFI